MSGTSAMVPSTAGFDRADIQYPSPASGSPAPSAASATRQAFPAAERSTSLGIRALDYDPETLSEDELAARGWWRDDEGGPIDLVLRLRFQLAAARSALEAIDATCTRVRNEHQIGLQLDEDLEEIEATCAPHLMRACTSCGCTDELACDGGCWWVAENLCSQCAG